MKFLNNLDLQQNQLLNARAQCLAAPPQNPQTGMFYYNTTDNNFLVYTDEGWKSALSALYVLPLATANTRGGIKAAPKAGTDTVEVKIGTDEKLYVPTYPVIPNVTLAGNTAETNKYISSASVAGHKITFSKGTLPYIPTKVSDLTNDTGYITGYTETDPIFTAWNKSTGISITKSQVSDLIEATQLLPGLMSATDKERLDVLHALLEEDTANNVVDSINEILAIFNNYPEGADLVAALAGKVNTEEGKGLSTNDPLTLKGTLKTNYNAAYTHSQTTHAPSNAEQNVQSNWTQTVNTADDYIKNKPSIPTVTNDLTNTLKSNYNAAYIIHL